MKRLSIIILSLVMTATAIQAEPLLKSVLGFLKPWRVDVHLGYGIGGTAPIGMPATIRKLNKFSLTPNLMLGLDAHRQFDERWGFMTGIHFENKGMSIDASVKNYHMEITRGGQTLDGQFTGGVTTDVTAWMFTLPLQATFNVSNKVQFKLGPYFSYLTNRSFKGYAYNGYLRVGNPTGEKVELGSKEGERGDYDFSDHLRRFQWGIDLGVDWHLTKRFGAFADLSWGLSGIHQSDFHTVEQTLFPIYGTVGVSYRIR
ncbi:MAG: PorT family protein [Muribaculaceae bacterium]|nr:PorT family protein [Muribaculaceae bacterium]